MPPATPSAAARDAFRERLLDWAADNLRSFPWRDDPSPYEVLVAEILLTQTPAPRVAQIYPGFLEVYPSPTALEAADQDALADLLRPLGFQNRRADALGRIGERLGDKEIPRDVDALSDLPYVGRYGANATLCFGFGERRPIVDANVVRIYGRVFDADFRGAEDDEAWDFAADMLPDREVETYNLALVDFGAQVCTAKTPACGGCPMNEFCNYYDVNPS